MTERKWKSIIRNRGPGCFMYTGRKCMNRSNYFNYIEEKIDFLSYRISRRGKINLLDLNIYSETFFADMINMLLKLELKNLNAVQQNMEGIDLIDHRNKIIAQVSSTNTKQKIENSLKKKVMEDYNDYRFIFIPIVGESEVLRTKSFKNPYKVKFDPCDDIYDIKTILNIFMNMKIGEQQNFYTFIRDELGNQVDSVKVDSNLASIINILAKEDLGSLPDFPEINSFEINRKIDFNNLQKARSTIDMYKVYYGKLDEKYEEFDKQGVNKSLSVFSVLSNQYVKLQSEYDDDVEIFYSVINNVMKMIQTSRNYVEIPYEELEMCVCIIVVDAFIRCKIFKNPEGYDYVIAR